MSVFTSLVADHAVYIDGNEVLQYDAHKIPHRLCTSIVRDAEGAHIAYRRMLLDASGTILAERTSGLSVMPGEGLNYQEAMKVDLRQTWGKGQSHELATNYQLDMTGR